MKSYLRFALLICLSLPLPLSAVAIKKGDSTEQVIETLGKPMGTIELRQKTLLLYPQGEITLTQGSVTEIDLMSDEQFAKDQERLRLEREEWLADQERRQAAHTKEGLSIRADKMASREFATRSAKEQLDYWRSFQIRYPEVDVTEQISSSLAGYETELTELRSQQRIAELEARVAQAEKAAASARLETEKLRQETERSERSRNNGLSYYTDPVIDSRYYYRPPTITIHTSGQKKAEHSPRRRNGVYRYDDGPKESVAERATRILNEATGQ
ncbi:hypothetical protein QEH59_10825 [Coraliomargarita sp. SDUM461004]|uniref:Uncharacterized protein n=1 Tax=Thalassobacterium sedimentorum TaxID=3041258 RepID=A0ABU1AJC3_9BACT|nr:hypothetical protein [Coraliomargarita sp. SDUM461004]MDQ8194922.1 hypothetical protein [Coraliomargarita sp. SDUM461004]